MMKVIRIFLFFSLFGVEVNETINLMLLINGKKLIANLFVLRPYYLVQSKFRIIVNTIISITYDIS